MEQIDPQSIKHRCLEYHYTKLGRSSRYSIDALNTTTPNWADLTDIAQCTYMHGRYTPQSTEHRCLEYHYTKLGRSSRYSTMHIYVWQIDPPSQLSIDALNTATPNWGDLPQRTLHMKDLLPMRITI